MPQGDHKRLIRDEQLLTLRFITCSCHHNQSLFTRSRDRDIFAEALHRTREKHQCAILAWVLMPNHFHLLVVPRLPESPVDAVLNMLKSTCSRRVLVGWRQDSDPRLASTSGPFGGPRMWQPGGGYDRNVSRGEKLPDIINYIHANPVRRGLAGSPAEWQWSSAAPNATVPRDDVAEFRRREVERLIRTYGSLLAANRVVRALGSARGGVTGRLVSRSTGHAKP